MTHLSLTLDKRLFAQRLSFARERAGYGTLTALAEALNVSRQVVSRWETAKQVPTTNKLVELVMILGCSLDWLLLGRGSIALPGPAGT